MISKKQGKL